jgi:hypothetical protein
MPLGFGGRCFLLPNFKCKNPLKASLCYFVAHCLLTKLRVLGTIWCDSQPNPSDLAFMANQQITMRMTKMALCVSMFVYFACAVGVGRADAGCGDYLHHAGKRVFSDPATDSPSVPLCRGGNCHSAPTVPPVEPSRMVISYKHYLDFRVSMVDVDRDKFRGFELSDDILPSSTTLEVLTPPPIAAV